MKNTVFRSKFDLLEMKIDVHKPPPPPAQFSSARDPPRCLHFSNGNYRENGDTHRFWKLFVNLILVPMSRDGSDTAVIARMIMKFCSQD